MAKIRVLLVEDSLTVRKRLGEVLSTDPGFEVVGEAEDGKEAIELCQELHPDVITMDMMLPLMSGLAATEYIMAYCPTPILIVSSSTNRGELFKSYEALAAGAVDMLEKPNGKESDGSWERKFISTLRVVSRIRVITHPRGRLGALCQPQVQLQRMHFPPTCRGQFKLIAMGASTGGPSAIVEVLRGMPATLPVPILLVLHINEPFGVAFADWLDGQTEWRVKYARNGEPIGSTGGRVLMAPPGSHLVVRDGRLHLTLDPELHSCRPSVDVLFRSVARECGSGAAACLLTGMGRDGASGLLDVRNAGGFTIAQDEATSVVYGMPREAALLGAAERVLPLGEIGATLAEFTAWQCKGKQA
jgi:two-component system, chemotaxis family, protein-glutamate methylesterase/glutaminase